MAEPWVSVDMIAAPLGDTDDSVQASTTTKDMPAHRVGRLRKFKVTDVDDWVRRSGDHDANDGP